MREEYVRSIAETIKRGIDILKSYSDEDQKKTDNAIEGMKNWYQGRAEGCKSAYTLFERLFDTLLKDLENEEQHKPE
jgi:hypothetical protein